MLLLVPRLGPIVCCVDVCVLCVLCVRVYVMHPRMSCAGC